MVHSLFNKPVSHRVERAAEPGRIAALPSLSRRRFVTGLVAGGVMLSARGALAQFGHSSGHDTNTGEAPELSGPNVELVIAESMVNFTGSPRMATTINGSIPAPTLRFREGDEVTIRVTNRLPVRTSLHWHGILLPYEMDGVPGLSFQGIAPGETFTYRFRLRQSGTYWYHSHSGFQEMTGMYGALIIEPRESDSISADREHIVLLSDWTDDDPMNVFRKLKVQGDLYNLNQPTLGHLIRDISNDGIAAVANHRKMWNQMRMSPTDLADLSSATLTYLMNGKTPAGNWMAHFRRGEKIRLRIINGSSNTFYDFRIPGVAMTVVASDGLPVEPVTVDEFRFGPGETYDVIVQPEVDACTLFAQSMDRTGYVSGTLATSPELRAEIPEVDDVSWLTMADMMGAMSHDNNNTMSGHDEHAGHNMAQNHVPAVHVRHASTELGPSVDMRVDSPRMNLDDPGVGLRDNGRRVLTLSDLHSAEGVFEDTREATREIELHLTGNMERYSWSIDGLEFGDSTPVAMRQGERIRVTLHNDTMMTHPMHLHGMWSDLQDTQGNLLVRRHTIPVQPAQRISFLTTPNDLGRWAWHCHLLFHMDAGMFREVVVS